MRKISANLILPVSSPALRNGIIFINPDGSIADLVDTGGKLLEESSLEYYPGTITPGFILSWFRFDDYLNAAFEPADTNPDKTYADLTRGNKITGIIEKLEMDLLKNGIKGVGLVVPEALVSAGGFERMSKSSLFFHPVIELCPHKEEDEFKVFNRGIDLVSQAWNEFNLSCSLTACSPAMQYSDIGKFIDEYGRSHENMVSPKGDSATLQKSTLKNPFNLLAHSLAENPEMDFEDLISGLTLDAASRIFGQDKLGTLEKGMKPGLNLVSGNSLVKVLL